MVIWRYHSNGSLDTTFNGTGYVIHDAAAGGSSSNDVAYAIALDSSGKILVAGESTGATTAQDMVIWRYNPDGSLDTTFNFPKGFVVYNGTGANIGYGITIDASGKIFVAGYSYNSTNLNQDMTIWRYNPDGTLDTSFNTVGYVTHNNATGANDNDFGRGITIDSSGKVLVVGYSFNGANNDMLIWRYNPDGTLDTSFNGVGYVVHNGAAGGSGVDEGRAIAIDSLGKILVVGYSFNGANNDMVIWRYNPDGMLDTSFNGTGYIVHHNAAGGNGSDYGYGIRIDSQGRILVVGSSFGNGTGDDMVIWRFK